MTSRGKISLPISGTFWQWPPHVCVCVCVCPGLCPAAHVQGTPLISYWHHTVTHQPILRSFFPFYQSGTSKIATPIKKAAVLQGKVRPRKKWRKSQCYPWPAIMCYVYTVEPTVINAGCEREWFKTFLSLTDSNLLSHKVVLCIVPQATTFQDYIEWSNMWKLDLQGKDFC